MSRLFADPLDAAARLGACACGQDHGGLACEAAPPPTAPAPMARRRNRRSSARVFPDDATRRGLLTRFGAAAVAGALASFFPLGHAREAMAQATGTPEKKDLKIGFIPITCATPIIMAHPMGFYREARAERGGHPDRRLGGDPRQVASPANTTPPTCCRRCRWPCRSASASPRRSPGRWPAIENTNGQAITLATKHKDRRDPKDWKGFRFAVPFDFSMHNYLLRHYLAEHGIDPDKDVQIRVVPPPEMVANLRADNIDGFLGPDPFNQRAVFDGVGFIHILTKELWDGHPCCAFAVPRSMISETPNTFARPAARHRRGHRLRRQAGEPQGGGERDRAQNYLNQPETVVEQVLTGTFADGLGAVQRVPDRIGFDPFPWQSMAIWILTQMRRWGR